jgi:uncharacterized membrane protein YjgN (DUF898 family)
MGLAGLDSPAASRPSWQGAGAGALDSQGRFAFTGDGSEYFRIWVVNTVLTLVTLGVYSAWAKVRRARYLWQNTRLDGFVFDYHANPVAILRGRILAISLFAAYSFAFDFSRAVGLSTLLLLCLVGPWLFMRAQQFKLANTSWRGLRFGFDGQAPEAYRVALPILILWFSGTIVLAWFPTDPKIQLWAQSPVFLAIPWMHHRLKAYQHGRSRYGDRGFSFEPALADFYLVYAKGLGLVLAGVFVTIPLIGWMMTRIANDSGIQPDPPHGSLVPALMGIAMGFSVFLFSWPFLAARVQQTVWSATRLGEIRFDTRIRARRLLALTVQCVFLTLVTLGFYWPFASMRFARYRIECMRVESGSRLAEIAAGTHAGAVGAAGEGVADAFGLDLGL